MRLALLLILLALPAWAEEPIQAYVSNRSIGEAYLSDGQYYVSLDKLVRAVRKDIRVSSRDGRVLLYGRVTNVQAAKSAVGWLVPVRPMADLLQLGMRFNKLAGIIDLYPRNRSSQPAALYVNQGKGGEALEVTTVLVAGKPNVVCFFSQGTPLWLRLQPSLERLARGRADLAVLLVDVNRPKVVGTVDWQSPLMRANHLTGVPFFRLYDEKGNLTAEGDDAYQRVLEWLRKL
ncbi:MAG: hypothetical protein FJX76_08090 [Armatimonadetes bacterium]|nr:hypothetical protein [Armatimonadota bacterium]